MPQGAQAHRVNPDRSTGGVHADQVSDSAGEPLATSGTVSDVMVGPTVEIQPDTHFKQIAAVLREHHVNAIPVVDEHRVVLGVVTASDLLTRLAEAEPAGPAARLLTRRRHERQRRHAVLAQDLMTSPALTVSATDGIDQAARLAVRSGVHMLPVVDAEHRLVGIVTRGDLVGWYLRPDEQIQADVQRSIQLSDDVQAEVAGGVVTLTGNVVTAHDSLRVEASVRRVLGVVAVRNDIVYEWDDRYLGY